MKILEERPGFKIVCSGCNSVYLIESGDVLAEIDILCGKVNNGAPDLHAKWNCPICGQKEGRWLYTLPFEWRDDIKNRSGFPNCQKVDCGIKINP